MISAYHCGVVHFRHSIHSLISSSFLIGPAQRHPGKRMLPPLLQVGLPELTPGGQSTSIKNIKKCLYSHYAQCQEV